MIRIFVIFWVLVAAIIFTPNLIGNQGFVYINFLGYSIETSCITLFLLLILVYLLLNLFISLIKKIFSLYSLFDTTPSDKKVIKILEKILVLINKSDYKTANLLLSKTKVSEKYQKIFSYLKLWIVIKHQDKLDITEELLSDNAKVLLKNYAPERRIDIYDVFSSLNDTNSLNSDMLNYLLKTAVIDNRIIDTVKLLNNKNLSNINIDSDVFKEFCLEFYNSVKTVNKDQLNNYIEVFNEKEFNCLKGIMLRALCDRKEYSLFSEFLLKLRKYGIKELEFFFSIKYENYNEFLLHLEIISSNNNDELIKDLRKKYITYLIDNNNVELAKNFMLRGNC
jgi:hypothetical protein